MEYFVYILQSQKDQRYYIGQTNNLEKRINQHNSGKSKYTKSFRPWNLIAFKKCDTRADAMRLETKLKNLKSHTRIMEFLVNNGFNGSDGQEVIGPEK